MKHKILFILFWTFITLGAQAQNTLNIHQKDGGIVSYSFDEKPRVYRTTDGIHLKTTKVDIDFPLSNLLRFTFEDTYISIGTVRMEGTNDDVCIYTMSGVVVKKIPAGEGKSFSLNDLPSGTYIVKNGKTNYKIIKR